MAEDWYSQWYKEHNKRVLLDKEAKSKEDTTKPKLSREFTQKLNQASPPTPSPSSSRYLDYRKKEQESHPKPAPPPMPYESPKPPQKIDLKNYYSKPYYPSLSPKSSSTPPHIIKTLPVEEKPKPEIVLAQVEKNIVPVNKSWIILGTLIIILIILGGIYFFTQQNTEARLMPIDITASNKTSDAVVYYNNKYLFTLSGWETQIEYANQTDRLFGNEQYKKVIFDDKGKAYTAITLDNEIRLESLSTDPTKVTRIGWFANANEVFVTEQKSFTKKKVNVLFNSDKDLIKNASMIYNIYKGRPYFKLQFSAGVDNESLLGDFKYGLVLAGYDIYSQSGEMFENDNVIIKLNKSLELTLVQEKNATKNISQSLKDSVAKAIDTNRQAVARKGSTFEDNSDYQIFVDKNSTKAIIVYSPHILMYNDLFYWNVFQINVLQLDKGEYSPLYIIVINNPKLTYNNETQDWIVDSKQYKGEIKSYIDKVIGDIGDETV